MVEVLICQVEFVCLLCVEECYFGEDFDGIDLFVFVCKQFFFLFMLVVLLFMGGVMYVFIQSIFLIMFVVLLLLFMIGIWLMMKNQQKWELEEDKKCFEEQLEWFDVWLQSEWECEIDVCCCEVFLFCEVSDVVFVVGFLVWMCCIEYWLFLYVCFGIGDMVFCSLVKDLNGCDCVIFEYVEKFDVVVDVIWIVFQVLILEDFIDVGVFGIVGFGGWFMGYVCVLFVQFMGLYVLVDVGVVGFWGLCWGVQLVDVKWLLYVWLVQVVFGVQLIGDGLIFVGQIVVWFEEFIVICLICNGDVVEFGVFEFEKVVMNSGLKVGEDLCSCYDFVLKLVIVVFIVLDVFVDCGCFIQLFECVVMWGIFLVWFIEDVVVLLVFCCMFVEFGVIDSVYFVWFGEVVENFVVDEFICEQFVVFV